jgi:hypothetical protein
MHYRRIVCFILGMWFGGGLIMAWYGSQSIGAVNDMMNSANPALLAQTKPMGPAATRQVLRYVVAEQNRWMFRSWEILQIILGLLFFSYLLFGTTEGKFTLAISLAMVLLTLVQRLGISPELGVVGRSMDYVPTEFVNQEHAKFWLLHNAYLGVDALKYGLGVVLGAIALSRKRSGDPLNQFNMIDKANHRHVNW